MFIQLLEIPSQEDLRFLGTINVFFLECLCTKMDMLEPIKVEAEVAKSEVMEARRKGYKDILEGDFASW